jgi:hypothetical protein
MLGLSLCLDMLYIINHKCKRLFISCYYMRRLELYNSISSSNKLYMFWGIFFMFLFLLISSCKDRSNYPYSRCFPYKVSDKIIIRTEYLKEFGMIYCEINADVEYHVLPDAGMQSYITIEGPENFVNKINCTSVYDSRYNQNEINISYDRCVSRKRNPKIKVHIYGHELFQIYTFLGNFVSRDTLRSNDGYINFRLTRNTSIDIICDVPNLIAFLPSSASFRCQGKSDSCFLYVSSHWGKSLSQPISLEGLFYRSLNYRVQSGENSSNLTNIFIGRPDTIYYRIDERNFNTYYQGDPVLIDRGSRFFTLFKKD